MLDQQFPMNGRIMKLCVMIVPRDDSDRLSKMLSDADFHSTKISSSGGFLGKGSSTIFSAIDELRLGDLISLLRKHFPETVESVPASSLPFTSEPDLPSTQMIDIRVGGVVVFIVPLEAFGAI